MSREPLVRSSNAAMPSVLCSPTIVVSSAAAVDGMIAFAGRHRYFLPKFVGQFVALSIVQSQLTISTSIMAADRRVRALTLTSTLCLSVLKKDRFRCCTVTILLFYFIINGNLPCKRLMCRFTTVRKTLMPDMFLPQPWLLEESKCHIGKHASMERWQSKSIVFNKRLILSVNTFSYSYD